VQHFLREYNEDDESIDAGRWGCLSPSPEHFIAISKINESLQAITDQQLAVAAEISQIDSTLSKCAARESETAQQLGDFRQWLEGERANQKASASRLSELTRSVNEFHASATAALALYQSRSQRENNAST
jgi:septal ring factor EnvC (AmiA/AmiB activator)